MGQTASTAAPFSSSYNSLGARSNDASWRSLIPGLKKDPSLSDFGGTGGHCAAQLHAAARQGRARVLEDLIGSLKLHALAACGGQQDALRLPDGAGVGADGGTGPADAAAVALVRQALDARSKGGETALMMACRRAHVEAVRVLLREGANPLLTDFKRRRTALHHAAIGGSAQCVAAVLARCGADAWRVVNAFSSDGFGPIHFAAVYGHSAVVRALLAAGAHALLPSCNVEGRGSLKVVAPQSTALHLAAMRCHTHVAVVILESYVTNNRNGGALAATATTAAAAVLAAGGGSGGAERQVEEDRRILSALGLEDPRAARNMHMQTPFEVARACGHTQRMHALLHPEGPVGRALLMNSFELPDGDAPSSLQALASRVLRSALIHKLDRIESELDARALVGAASCSCSVSVRAQPVPVPAPSAQQQQLQLQQQEGQQEDDREQQMLQAAMPSVAATSADTQIPAAYGASWSSCDSELPQPAAAAATAQPSAPGAPAADACEEGACAEGSCSDAIDPIEKLCGSCWPIDSDDDCDDDEGCCGICLEAEPAVELLPCRHSMCAKCTRGVLLTAREEARCPFCRHAIGGLEAASD